MELAYMDMNEIYNTNCAIKIYAAIPEITAITTFTIQIVLLKFQSPISGQLFLIIYNTNCAIKITNKEIPPLLFLLFTIQIVLLKSYHY